MMKKMRDYGEVNNLNLKLVIALARTGNSEFRKTLNLLKKYKLTISQFGVLEALYHLGELCINQLIEKTLSTSGNMTVVVKNLERDGYIAKVQSPTDKRRWIIQISEKGSQLIETVFPEHLADLNQGFSNLDFSEKNELLRLLKKLNGYESNQEIKEK